MARIWIASQKHSASTLSLPRVPSWRLTLSRQNPMLTSAVLNSEPVGTTQHHTLIRNHVTQFQTMSPNSKRALDHAGVPTLSIHFRNTKRVSKLCSPYCHPMNTKLLHHLSRSFIRPPTPAHQTLDLGHDDFQNVCPALRSLASRSGLVRIPFVVPQSSKRNFKIQRQEPQG